MRRFTYWTRSLFHTHARASTHTQAYIHTYLDLAWVVLELRRNLHISSSNHNTAAMWGSCHFKHTIKMTGRSLRSAYVSGKARSFRSRATISIRSLISFSDFLSFLLFPSDLPLPVSCSLSVLSFKCDCWIIFESSAIFTLPWESRSHSTHSAAPGFWEESDFNNAAKFSLQPKISLPAFFYVADVDSSTSAQNAKFWLRPKWLRPCRKFLSISAPSLIVETSTRTMHPWPFVTSAFSKARTIAFVCSDGSSTFNLHAPLLLCGQLPERWSCMAKKQSCASILHRMISRSEAFRYLFPLPFLFSGLFPASWRFLRRFSNCFLAAM